MNTYAIQSLLVSLLLISFYTNATQETVANVQFARGTVAAQIAEEDSRLLGKDSDVFSKDNVQTADRSFAVLDFVDTTKLTIRPNSNISIEKYQDTGMEQRAQLVLHAGGTRVGGGIKKYTQSKNYQVDTGDTLIKPQEENSEFTIRKCKTDCKIERDHLLAKLEKKEVAKIITLEGSIEAVGVDGKHYRKLEAQSPLYENDKITTTSKSHAVLRFIDGSKFTLIPNSVFEIKKHKYEKTPQKDRASYDLMQGGIRVLTGLIGKEKKDNFTLNTPVATLGIRGTGFDTICRGICTNKTVVASTMLLNGDVPGLYTHVWQGGIQQNNNAGIFPLELRASNYIANEESKPVKLESWPSVFEGKPLGKPPSAGDQQEDGAKEKQGIDDRDYALFTAPRPDQINEALLKAPSLQVLSDLPEGTYVTVHDGLIKVTTGKGDFFLGKSDSVYVDNRGEVIYLNNQLNYVATDSYPRPLSFNPKFAEIGPYSLLAETIELINEEEYECVIK